MKKKKKTMSKIEGCEKVARDLRIFGYPDVDTGMVLDILNAWLEGKRGHDLPYGVIGLIAGGQFDDIESEVPGALAALTE